ncbi:MAG: hypothetical protein E7241_02415 [Lachnospiraceae bacterium]|nr:hypothetical protein [Lachnospiraceae bacterium]
MNKRRRFRGLVAIVITLLLAVPAIPAQAADDYIEITAAVLQNARNNPGVEVAPGIIYIQGSDQGPYDEGTGVFWMNSAKNLRFGENLNLNKECFNIDDEGKDIKIDLNGKDINYEAPVTDGPESIPLLRAVGINIAFEGDGRISSDNGLKCVYCKNFSAARGTFGMTEASGKATISGGTFEDYVSVEGDATITGGTFKGNLVIDGKALIGDGSFESVGVFDDTVVNGGRFKQLYGGGINEIIKVTVNDGTFVYDGEFHGAVLPLTISDVNLIINGGTFINNNTSGTDSFAVSISTGSLTVTGGVFGGKSCSYALNASEMQSINISGGYFEGNTGGLLVELTDSTDTTITLSGGEFHSKGVEDDEDKEGAFIITGPVAKKPSEGVVGYFNTFLKDGCKFDPKASTIYIEGNEDFTAHTQNDLRVIPINIEPKVETENEEDEAALTDLIKELVEKGSMTGIDNALARRIMDAVTSGKTIGIRTKAVELTDRSDIETLINGALEDGERIAAYYDIVLAVSIDGVEVGNITDAGKDISFKVLKPDTMPELAGGYTRAFAFLRVHDNQVTRLQGSESGDYVESASSVYSIYALVYKDVVRSPNTGDHLYVVWFMILSGLTAISSLIYKFKQI